jgi:hypothetical protein
VERLLNGGSTGRPLSRYKRRSDPFGPLSSLVLRDVFAETERAGRSIAVPLAQIARRTGLNFYSVRRIASEVSLGGYAQRRHGALLLEDPLGVLDAWILAWRRLASRQLMSSFHVELEWNALVTTLPVVFRDIAWLWTGVAGAVASGMARGTPLQRVCYVTKASFDVARRRLVDVLQAIPTEDGGGEGTVHLIVPAEERGQWYRARRNEWGVAPTVSTLQLALDAACGPDARAPHSALAASLAVRGVLVGSHGGAGSPGGVVAARASA